jgi:hypothetical protein
VQFVHTGGDPGTGNIFISATDSGYMTINSPSIPSGAPGALNIVGSSTGNYMPVTGAGGILHITGNDDTLARITVDGFAANTTGPQPAQAGYGLIAMRSARGNVGSPSYVLAGDILASFSGLGWVGGGANRFSPGQVAGLQFFAAQDFTSNTATGTYAQIKLSPIGANAGIVAANITANGISTATVTTTGNITSGNILTAGLISASGNITSGNILTAGLISASGNITSGNLSVSGLVGVNSVSATGNITGGNILTAGIVSSTGNATHGNILTAGIVSSTGNAIHGNILTAGIVSSTGNIYGGNVLFDGGVVSGTGNVAAGNIAITNIATTKIQQYTPYNIGDANLTIAVDFTNGSVQYANLISTNNPTVTLSNLLPGQTLTLIITNTSGTNRNVTHGCSAANSTTGAAAVAVNNNRIGIFKYYSVDTTAANCRVGFE